MPAASQETILKGSSVIAAVATPDVIFEPCDNSLFNYLLFRTFDDLRPGVIHTIPMRDAMEYLRIDRVSKLQASLDRLCKGSVLIDYHDETLGEDRQIRAHYLSSDVSRAASGLMHFAFDPILSVFLPHPKVYAVINIKNYRDFKTAAAQKLYEHMSLTWRKKHPTWQPTVDELRAIFQVGDRYARFDNLRTHVIEKAVAEVNVIAEFGINVDYVRGGQGGGVVAVEFRAVTKTHQSIMQASTIHSTKPAKKGRAIDPHTVDILDGMTFEERGGPAEITSKALDLARELMPDDADINQLVTEWREVNRGRVLNDADANFAAWLAVRMQQDADPLLSEIDGDVFGNLLGDRD